MAACSDRRFEEMLYAYELGILPDAERAELEQHILECDSCFEKASGFESTARLLRESQAVRHEVEALAGGTTTRPRERARRATWIRSGLAVATVLVILLLRPWRLEFQPDQPAQADTYRLAVAPFQNLTDDAEVDRLCEIATGLLVTDLSESHYIQVISSRRLAEEAPVADSADEESTLEAARRADARWLLSGRIMRHLDSLSMDVHLLNVEDGTVLAASRVDGSGGSSIFSLVDSLTVLVKADLPLPQAARTEYDPDIAEVTTHSPEAYYHYLQGVRYQYQYFNDDAVASFLKALEYDSTLAMAYFYLAGLSDGRMIHKAVEYSSGASQKEKLMILSRAATADGEVDSAIVLLRTLVSRYPDEKSAWYRLGQLHHSDEEYDSAIVAFRRVLAIDPRFKGAYNQLAYAFSLADVPDSALWAIEKYIALAPDEPNPYDTRGDLYAFNGELEKAARSYARAVELKPSFAASDIKLAMMQLFLRRFDDASAILHRYADNPEDPSRVLARLYLACLPLAQGDFARSLALLDSLGTLSRTEFAARGQYGIAPSFDYVQALIYSELEEWDLAAAAAEKAARVHIEGHPKDSLNYLPMYAKLLNRAGRSDSASRVVEFLARHETTSANGRYQYRYALAYQAETQNDFQRMLAESEKLAGATLPCSDFAAHYLLAQAYLADGRLSQAVPLWEKLAATYTEARLLESLGGVKVHYYLAQAYEESHWYDRAIQQYELFLSAWSHADPDLPVMRDARERLTRLKNRS